MGRWAWPGARGRAARGPADEHQPACSAQRAACAPMPWCGGEAGPGAGGHWSAPAGPPTAAPHRSRGPGLCRRRTGGIAEGDEEMDFETSKGVKVGASRLVCGSSRFVCWCSHCGWWGVGGPGKGRSAGVGRGLLVQQAGRRGPCCSVAVRVRLPYMRSQTPSCTPAAGPAPAPSLTHPPSPARPRPPHPPGGEQL